VEIFNCKVSTVVLVVFLTTICFIDNDPTSVVMSSSIVFLVYHLQCLPGGSLTTYCVECCISYRSLLFKITCCRKKAKLFALIRPSTSN